LKRGSGELSILYFDSYSLDFGSLSRTTVDRFADNRERTTFELLNISESDGFSSINVSRMRAEAHQRIVSPVTAIGYTIVGLMFLLRGSFDRRGQAARIVAAIFAVVALQAISLGAANLASQSSSFVSLMYFAAIIPIVGGFIVLQSPLSQQSASSLGAGTA
jgi:lipopolysaccharide export system permease protein